MELEINCMRSTLILNHHPSISLNNCNDQVKVVLLRCGTGHCKIAHLYLLTNDDAAICIPCNDFLKIFSTRMP